MTRFRNTLLIGIILIASGCSSDFSPNGSYKDKLVVFGVLSTQSDTQYIYLSSSLDPNTFDPLSPSPSPDIANATVTVTQGNTLYSFHDTLITTHDSKGIPTQRKVYVNYGFKVESNKIDTLRVVVPGIDPIISVAPGVSFGSLLAKVPGVFGKPSLQEIIPLEATLGNNVRAYMVRIFIEYEVLKDSVLKEYTEEIPESILFDNVGNIKEKYFHGLTYHPRGAPVTENISFDTKAYAAMIQAIKRKHAGSLISFRLARLRLIQVDENLYSYYSIVNGFPGSASIRLDEPDFTNINGGYGVFGVMTEYERTYTLPGDIN